MDQPVFVRFRTPDGTVVTCNAAEIAYAVAGRLVAPGRVVYAGGSDEDVTADSLDELAESDGFVTLTLDGSDGRHQDGLACYVNTALVGSFASSETSTHVRFRGSNGFGLGLQVKEDAKGIWAALHRNGPGLWPTA